jgi:putative acyl-CoA dehydrogenase
MTHYIRMDFSVASAGIMRRALTLALQHVRNRTAFGHRIADLPQMRNVLADLAIECEAALHLGMRMVSALDRESRSEADALLLRIGVPVAKYWNCKRVNHVVLEALECHGGMGYIEEQPVARLLREAPLNSIWEGTGAMMGLDFARAVRREPDTVEALLEEIRAGASGDRQLKTLAVELADELLHAGDLFEADARRLMGKAALGLQASLLRRFAPATTADLFVSSRLEQPGALEFGTLRAHAARLQEVTDRALGDASS